MIADLSEVQQTEILTDRSHYTDLYHCFCKCYSVKLKNDD